MTDEGTRALMAAIMVQAVKDYEHLCNLLASGRILESGPTSTKITTKQKGKTSISIYYSFAEIEWFVEHYGEMCIEIDPAIIITKLRHKRRKAATKAQKGR